MTDEIKTREQAYDLALKYCSQEAVEAAFCAYDDWEDAMESLGFVDE